MINKTIYIYFLFFLIFLTSCDQGKIKNSNQCLGEWKLLDDDSHKKSFILKENGKVEFNNLSIKDIVGSEEEQIPKAGTWKLVLDESKGSFLETIQDGDEYCYWDNMKQTGLVNMDMIDHEYPRED